MSAEQAAFGLFSDHLGNRTGRAKLEMAEEWLVSETQGIRHMNYKILMAN